MDSVLQELRRRVEAAPEDVALCAGLGRALARADHPLAAAYGAGLLCAPSLVERVAAEEGPVLLVGGDGPRRERVARTLHQIGPRRQGTWHGASPRELPESLFEAEVFGHVRGGFNGVRPGILEQAGIFLWIDDVDELTPSLGRRLRRAISTREVQRVGANVSRPVDARLVAGSTPGLAGALARERFDPGLAELLGRCVLRLADSPAGSSRPGAS